MTTLSEMTDEEIDRLINLTGGIGIAIGVILTLVLAVLFINATNMTQVPECREDEVIYDSKYLVEGEGNGLICVHIDKFVGPATEGPVEEAPKP